METQVRRMRQASVHNESTAVVEDIFNTVVVQKYPYY
jgi:hypothetical protein